MLDHHELVAVSIQYPLCENVLSQHELFWNVVCWQKMF